MTDLADGIARAILADAGLGEDPEILDAGDETHLALVKSSAAAEREASELLQRAVVAARAVGVSWARIGDRLGMTRQAAQQRFGRADTPEDGVERWLGPVTAFDEMVELELAGRQGWHTVGAGLLTHRLVHTPTQWEHRRTIWRSPSSREREEGWEVAVRAFPWVYWVRDTGIPAERAEGSGG